MSAADLAKKIFAAADVIRGSMDPQDYTDALSAMLLLKWASDQPGWLEVPKRARWDHVVERGGKLPGEALDNALAELLDSNRGILGDLFWNLDFTRGLSRPEAEKLINHFNGISLKSENLKFEDVVAQAYDQVLGAFADAAGRKGGEFYTPRSVIQLMVRLAHPETGQSVYDPVAGSGGMLTCAEEYVAGRSGRHGNLALFAQEMNAATCRIARLNLVFHGAPHASVRCGDTLVNPLHVTDDGRLRRFDRILSNPPFSVNYRQEEVRFTERMRYGWGKKADLMFVQHVLSTLAPDGVGVVVAPHGVLFRGGAEAEIRRGIVHDNRLEAVIGIGPNVFHGTSVPACVLVLRGDGGAPRGRNGVLFINAEHEITTGRSRNYLDPRHEEKIAVTFNGWREIPHFSRVVLPEEIAHNDFNLNIRLYVDPAPSAVTPLNPISLLHGGIPKADVEAQRDRFRAFGIDVTDFFLPGRWDYLRFPSEGYEAAAEKIPERASKSEYEFLSRLRGWLNRERSTILDLNTRTLSTIRDFLIGSFRRELLPLAILDEHQLVGVFADWWAAHHDDLRELSRAGASSEATDRGARETILNTLEAKLLAGTKNIVALERQRLVDIYRSWGDQYGTSLLDLEKKRKMSTERLKPRLRELGYPWLDGP